MNVPGLSDAQEQNDSMSQGKNTTSKGGKSSHSTGSKARTSITTAAVGGESTGAKRIKIEIADQLQAKVEEEEEKEETEVVEEVGWMGMSRGQEHLARLTRTGDSHTLTHH